MQVRKLRLLRLKYRISLMELSRVTELTPQRISEIELNAGNMQDTTVQKLLGGIEQVILLRQKDHAALQYDFQLHKDTLMEMVGEADYGL